LRFAGGWRGVITAGHFVVGFDHAYFFGKFIFGLFIIDVPGLFQFLGQNPSVYFETAQASQN
jgi:hypothetical protein